jgi:hypothetical protein
VTDTPPTPKRRRWRWLLVGTLLLVVSIAGWWYWRRPDQRFVGTWEVYSDGRKLPIVNTYYGDGSACHFDLSTGTKTYFQWHAYDDTFVIPLSVTPLAIKAILDNWIRRIRHPDLTGYKVLKFSENEIRMRMKDPNNQQSLVTMRRMIDRHIK